MISKRTLLWTILFCSLVMAITACQTPQIPQSANPETELIIPETDPKQISSIRADELTLLRTYAENGVRILDVAFSPSGMVLAASGQDRVIRVWDTGSSKELYSFLMQSVDMADIDLSPDGRLMASGEAVWDLESGQELYTLERGSPIPAFIAFQLPDEVGDGSYTGL